jgi:prepilin-type N-terminal cleavage/methylation domain-containing protein
MQNFKKNRGFTLIELLVVVAIIGILATVVIVALTDSRTKGADGTVKSQLLHARSQAEVFFNTNTVAVLSYTNVCTNGLVGGIQGIGAQILYSARAVGLAAYTINGTGTLTTATCNSNASAYAAEVPLKSGGMWCIDSTGKSKYEVGTIGAGFVCA